MSPTQMWTGTTSGVVLIQALKLSTDSWMSQIRSAVGKVTTAKSRSRRRFIFTICLIFKLSLLIHISHQNTIYIYVPSLLNQSDAKIFCREHYTNPASFTNASKMTAIQTLYPKVVYCWIGLQRIIDASPVGIWSDGETYNFTQWYPGEPNNYGGIESCVALKHNAWFDVSRDRAFPFV